MTNTFFWYELLTEDVSGAIDYYQRVVGWDARAFPGANDYHVLHAGGTGVGGIMALPEQVKACGGRPGWLGYIYTANVDEAVRKLADAGGTVHQPPTDIPSVGRFAVVADPQGATFNLMTPHGEDGQAVPPMTPGHIGWHELYAEDWEAAFQFYAGQFGWTKAEAIEMGPLGTYQLFATGAEPTGGMMNRMGDMPPLWLYYFNVPDIDEAATRITDHGGTIVMEPHEVPGGSWIVMAKDPQGVDFAVVAPPRS